MRSVWIGLLAGVVAAAAWAQSPAAGNPARDAALALSGDWTGYLEYRDYSEPATSTKRVQLPTWLTVSPSGTGLSFHYIYDDGPRKTVDETDIVVLDAAKKTYTSTEAGHPAEVYTVAGLDQLREGHGQLVMTGTGTDNNQPAELRLTVTIRRNLMEWLLEERPAGSNGEFTFRHFYRFTRSKPPAVTAGH
ncbi:MAG TPA: hypothetical protein VGG85_14930 [Terracidiphilus sp.]|jgi:hypothetical protein